MERVKRSFSLQRRSVLNKRTGKVKLIWYVQFRDQNGDYLPAKSTGQTSKARAELWAQMKLDKGYIPTRTAYLFEKYVEGFWEYDTSHYIQGRLARGYSFSRTFASVYASITKNHLIPVFGKCKLHEITYAMIDGWVLAEYTKKVHSSISINKWLTALRIILDEACFDGFLSENLAKKVKPLKEEPRVRGILTPQEVQALFCGDALAKVWGGNLDGYLINLIAVGTGMRQGEIRALQWKQIDLDNGVIDVIQAWEDDFGYKQPKAGSMRAVPLAPKVVEVLRAARSRKPNWGDEDFVFPGRDSTKPRDKRGVLRSFYDALNRIGISEKECETRNLTFHSYRHFFNTYNRAAGVDLSKLQKITGHKTLKMVENYAHYALEDLIEVREKVTALLG